MIKPFFGFLIIFAVTICLGSTSNAHDVFQDVLKEVYTLKSFSCKGCHPDSDNRKLRTPFAERIYKQLKAEAGEGKSYSEQFAEAAKADEEAEKVKKLEKGEGQVAEFDKMIAKKFKVAFKTVAVQKISFDEMFKQNLFNGARLDTKKIAAKAAAEGASKSGVKGDAKKEEEDK